MEHVSTRQVDGTELLARFRVDPVRLRASRRMWAMLWLRLLAGTDSADEQDRRLVDLLGD